MSIEEEIEEIVFLAQSPNHDARAAIREALADTWDAGYGEGVSAGAGYPCEPNPYRESGT